jgi:hypothetical protein
MLAEHGAQVTRREIGETIVLDLSDGSAVQFAPAWDASVAQPDRRLVMLTFADAGLAAVPACVTVFDLAASRVLGVQDERSDLVRELCRRRGIRFRPLAWRYRVGHFEGERFVRRG